MTQTLDMQKYRDKLKILIEMAKKKKNVLEHSEIVEVYQDMNLTAEQMESVYDYLENQNRSIRNMNLPRSRWKVRDYLENQKIDRFHGRSRKIR